MSMIPFTSPMVMIARIPFDIAQWQIWLSFAILIASFVGMAWFAGKVYRIGIFMYGKKPTVKDIIRWARYKYGLFPIQNLRIVQQILTYCCAIRIFIVILQAIKALVSIYVLLLPKFKI